MLFRQASVDVRPPPLPSEPVRFDGDAYQSPRGRKIEIRVLRRPTGQKARIEAKRAQRLKEDPVEPPKPPAYCGDSNRPPPMASRTPEPEPMIPSAPATTKTNVTMKPMTDGDALEAEFARNRAEDLARLAEPAPIVPAILDASSRSTSKTSSDLRGPGLTPEELNALTARARKEQMKRRGVIRSGNLGSATSKKAKVGEGAAQLQSRVVLGSSQRRVKIPSGQDKKRTDQKQAIAKRRENKRPLKSIEVTDELRTTTAMAALKEFKGRGIANTHRVLVALIDLLSPADGKGNEGLVAAICRRIRREESEAPAKEVEVNKKFLLNAAKKAISDLTKSAKGLLNDDANVDVSNDAEMRRRFGAGRGRSSPSKDKLQIRQRVLEDGRVLYLLITVKKSGQKTLVGAVIDRS